MERFEFDEGFHEVIGDSVLLGDGGGGGGGLGGKKMVSLVGFGGHWADFRRDF